MGRFDLAEYLAERDVLFVDLTPAKALAYWKKKGFPPPVDPSVPLAMVHKARLQWLDATDAMLAESLAWLEAHGYLATMNGAPPLTPETRDRDRAALGKPPLRE